MGIRRTSILVAVIALVAAPVALAAGLPKVPTGPGAHPGFKVKPASISISQDGSFYFAGQLKANNRAAPLKWTSWRATAGHGSGFNWVNNCHPNCAQGKFHRYPVKIRVWRRKHVAGHLIFTRMTVTYTKGHPRAVPSDKDVFKATHKNGQFFWNYPS